MLRIMYCPDCCLGLSTACIDDWLSTYIRHLLYRSLLSPAMIIPRWMAVSSLGQARPRARDGFPTFPSGLGFSSLKILRHLKTRKGTQRNVLLRVSYYS